MMALPALTRMASRISHITERPRKAVDARRSRRLRASRRPQPGGRSRGRPRCRRKLHPPTPCSTGERLRRRSRRPDHGGSPERCSARYQHRRPRAATSAVAIAMRASDRNASRRVPHSCCQTSHGGRHACKIEGAAEGRRAPLSPPSAARQPESKLKGASREMVKSMSEKQLEEFASGPRKGKPERVGDQR